MKRLFRLKRKTGAVLFAVVCVMALLITMATTAYYTARSAYNSVVSNYNYSQLYLSAISVADMVTGAVINDSIPAATGANKNDYAQLRNAILGMTTVGTKLYARTSNINATDVGNDQAVISTLESQPSVIDGVLDGVVVEAEVTSSSVSIVPDDKTIGGKLCDKYIYDLEYTLTTTAYYGNNSITVQDVIAVEKNEWYDEAERKQNLIEVENNKDPNPPDFNTFLTATGQGLTSDGEGKAQPSFPSRTVKIMTHQISDDAFFQNDKTYFMRDSANNEFLGGINSTGDVYLNHFKTTIGEKDYDDPSTYNDWFVGGNLAITHANANKLDLKNNNLYVKKDLILDGSATLTAKDIYVEGDLYILSDATTNINGNLHVTGNIYYQMDASNGSEWLNDDRAKETFNSYNSAITDGVEFSSSSTTSVGTGVLNINSNPYVTVDDENPINGSASIAGDVVVPEGSSSAKIKVEGGDEYTFSSTSSAADAPDISGYDSTQIKDLEIASRGEDSDSDEYTTGIDTLPLISYDTVNSETGKTEQVSGVFDTKVGTNQTYSNYTASDATYNNSVTIDYSKLEAKDANGNEAVQDPNSGVWNTAYFSYTDEATGITITSDGKNLTNGKITVDIPFNKTGYAVEITGFGENVKMPNGTNAEQGTVGNQTSFVYNIETDTTADAEGNYDTMPIVLKSNITTTSTDSSGNTTSIPGFSWQGSEGVDSANGNTVQVLAVAKDSSGNIIDVDPTKQGNIIFEMASYDKTTNQYGPYNADKYAETGSVVYVAGAKEFVGTKAQADKINDAHLGSDTVKSGINAMLGGDSIPDSPYDNKFMLVSNVNGTTAMNVTNINNLFCGYVYAPNGKMEGDNQGIDGERIPVFGGMIVSNYDVDKGFVYYAEPRPSMIANTIGALNKWGVGNDNSDTDKKTIITEEDIPANGLMDSNSLWEFKGSNYVG